jgi:hypothetical protein
MTAHDVSRRHFLAAVAALLGTSACVPVPRLTEGPPRVGPRTAMRLGPAPIKGPDAKFAFVEITGAPANHVIEFDRALDSEAAVRNLTIVPVGDPSATYLVKGYLSAIGDRGGTLLIYVWDVSDMTGRRLHRVTGQEPSGGSSADPWSGISSETVRVAAQRTIDDLIAWAS